MHLNLFISVLCILKFIIVEGAMDKGNISLQSGVSAFCPRCQGIRNMNYSDLKNMKIDGDNKFTEIIIRSYYCSVCGIFVRSDNINPTNKQKR